MTGGTLGLLVGLLVALVVVGIFEAARILVSACQWFFSSRPFSGRGVSPTCSLPGEGGHDGPTASHPQHYRSTHGRLLSSPSPARCTPDLESGGRTWMLLPLGIIDTAPNLSAFSAGIELAVFTALFTIGSLLVLNWIIKTMRSSR